MAESGQITVTTAGTAVQGTDVDGMLFLISAHPDNTDTVWIGNDGSSDVTNANGFPLQPTGAPIPMGVVNLDRLWFDADMSGEKICWLKIQA